MPIAESRMRLAVALLLTLSGLAGGTRAQGVDATDRPVADVSIDGVSEAESQRLLNQLLLEPGDPYDADVVARDIRNLTRLGRFATVRVGVRPNPDGTVNVTYIIEEQTLLQDVQVVGNKAYSDRELMEDVLLRAGDPRDPFLIDQARDRILRKYRNGGYFLAEVGVDERTLDEAGVLVFRVREGPRVKVRGVTFEGNDAFTDEQLESEIETETYAWIFRKGVISEDRIDRDVARLRDFYRERGYLDARVGRRIALSDDQTDATIEFTIDEGRQYTISEIEIGGNELFSDKQIRRAMALKRGDVFSADRLRETRESLLDLYGKLGFIETEAGINRVFHPTEPTVTLRVDVEEGRRYTVGNVVIRGNPLTQDKVVRRQVRGLEPGRPYDRTGIEATEQRIRETGLFREAEVTVQGDEDDEVRDALIEVKEAGTGSLNLGGAVSSDSGVFGAISLTQRNFDIQDTPDSVSEFLTGQAFRGAGQYFSLTLQPGTRFQRYQVNFREPYLFDSDYFLDTSAFFFQREREDWDEQRTGGVIGLGKRFGDVWSASLRTRLEGVRVEEVEPDAPLDAFEVEGNNFVDSVGFFLTRSTVDSQVLPTRGTRFEAGIERIGTLGGDFDFTRLTGEFNAFLPIDEDFFGRHTVLQLSLDTGYILEENESPLFERFYAGGHRTFRGFDYRGAGPRGIRADTGREGNDPVGGDFMFLLGAEYSYPIYEENVRGVFFVDSGTVREDIGLGEYRVSVGAGVRLQLPFLGQAPFAFDLAYPIVKEEGDETRFFSFDLALPF